MKKSKQANKKYDLRYFFSQLVALFFIGISLILCSSVFADNATLPDQAISEVEAQIQSIKQKTDIILQRNESIKQELELLRRVKREALSGLSVDTVNQRILDQALLDLTIARANYDGSQIAYTEAQHIIDASTNKIDSLENELRYITLAAGKTNEVNQRIQKLETQLNSFRRLQKIEQKELEAVNKSVDLSKQMLQIQEHWNNQIEYFFQLAEQQVKQQKLQQQEKLLEEEQQQWLSKLFLLNQQLHAYDQGETDLGKSRERFQFEIFEAQEKSNLVHLRILIGRIQNQLALIENLDEENTSVMIVNEALNRSQVLFTEASDLKKLIERKLELIESQKKIAGQSKDSNILSKSDLLFIQQLLKELQNRYQQQLQKISTIKDTIVSDQSLLRKELNHALSRRQGLPGFSLEAWANLGEKLTVMPDLAVQAANAIGVQIQRALINLKTSDIVVVVICELLLFVLWYTIRKLLDKVLKKIAITKQSISENLVFVILRLLRTNITSLYVFSALITMCWFSGVPIKSLTPLIYLLIVYFVFKIAIRLARITLLETAPVTSGHDVQLYRNLVWALGAGGVLTMLTVLAYQLPVDYEVSDFFNRLFMLFLLVMGALLLRHWKVMPDLVMLYIDTARPYFMRAVRLLSVLIPISILLMALIGFMGYVDLAWAISKYEGLFLFVLCAYVILRGFLIDFMEWLSELFIRRLQNGWVLAQAILRPLTKILKVILFLGAMFVLFMLYDWDQNSYVVKEFETFLNFKLIAIEQTVITPLGIIEFIVAAAILIWVSKWTREFAYRFVFSRTLDLGLRNSFAAFTQYTTVTIGLIASLKIIGIDFTSISYILTALAVGIGFGLRDLAKNYVSGLLLLIERPVRRGDFITIGEYEGEVTNIGMRSMTVKTWDHMEVLVPNSETFEKPFTNWTHQDSIVRTVITVKISRQDDPFFVQKLIYDVLDEINDIVTDPSPRVLLRTIDDTLIEFQVRYFINLQKNNSRAEVRSRVLFAIWVKFKEHAIRPPIPQQEFHVLNFPSRISDEKLGDEPLVDVSGE